MPLNALISVEQSISSWTNTVELQLVESKTRVDTQRYEPQTSSYALVNLGSRYQFADKASLTMGIRNLFNRQYDLPRAA